MRNGITWVSRRIEDDGKSFSSAKPEVVVESFVKEAGVGLTVYVVAGVECVRSGPVDDEENEEDGAEDGDEEAAGKDDE